MHDFDHSLTGIAESNLVGGVDVRVLCCTVKDKRQHQPGQSGQNMYGGSTRREHEKEFRGGGDPGMVKRFVFRLQNLQT